MNFELDSSIKQLKHHSSFCLFKLITKKTFISNVNREIEKSSRHICTQFETIEEEFSCLSKGTDSICILIQIVPQIDFDMLGLERKIDLRFITNTYILFILLDAILIYCLVVP